jgi:hypothetical protein
MEPLTVKLHGVAYVVVNPEDYNMHLGAGGGRVEALAWGIGAYGSIHLITLWHNMGDALEVVGGWLEDNAPGQLTTQDEMAELAKEAREELGPGASDEEVWEAAEVDLMYTESGWLPSWEVSAQEIHGEELRTVLLAALEYDEDIDEEDYQERLEELAAPNPRHGARRNLSRRAHEEASEEAIKRMEADPSRRSYWAGAGRAHRDAGYGEAFPEPGSVHFGARRNYTKQQHEELADRYRGAEAAYQTAGQLQAQMGEENLAATYYDEAPGLGGQQRAHFQAAVRPYGVALDKADAVVRRAGEELEQSVDARMRYRDNPPAAYRWGPKGRLRSYSSRTGNSYGFVADYKPRTLASARLYGGIYETQKGQKVPKGTKYLALQGWRGRPMVNILGAHKTLAAAKREVEKQMGLRDRGPSRAALGGPKDNPPIIDGKWTKQTPDAHVYPMGREYALVVKYAPRSFGLSRSMGAQYEHQLQRTVPEGTKYLSVHGWYDPPQSRVLGAHKTLKAAKAAALKDLGAPKAKRNKPKGSRAQAFKVQVRSSARARPVKVKLPGKAGATKVAGKVIHRSVSYAGGKARLIKGWTVSSPAGIGLAKFKTKAAAERHARR